MKKKLVISLLTCVAMLPLGVLYLFSDFIFCVVYRVLRYRKKVVRKNLTEAFPEKSEREIGNIEKEYYHFMCDIIVETVKLLHISPRQLRRRVEVTNPDIVNACVAEGRSAVLMLGHYGNWEWVQEITNVIIDGPFKASIYRPLNSRLWNEVYQRIRSRWNVEIIPQKSAVKVLLDKAHQPWVCGFIADARPRHVEEDAKVPFLNHLTSFIYGPEVLGRKVGADFFFLEMERVQRGYYRITFHPLDGHGEKEPYPVTRQFWKQFEAVIKKSPAYWLWSHKRWKFDSLIDKG